MTSTTNWACLGKTAQWIQIVTQKNVKLSRFRIFVKDCKKIIHAITTLIAILDCSATWMYFQEDALLKLMLTTNVTVTTLV